MHLLDRIPELAGAAVRHDFDAALALGVSSCYRRILLNEGRSMEVLLQALYRYSLDEQVGAQATLLLTTAGQTPAPTGGQEGLSLTETLSQWELDVLASPAGYRPVRSGDRPSPVLVGQHPAPHTKHIHTKLTVTTRRGAVRRAEGARRSRNHHPDHSTW